MPPKFSARRFPEGRRDLALELIAGLVSTTGDWILSTGLAYAVYALTGSTVASAAAGGFGALALADVASFLAAALTAGCLTLFQRHTADEFRGRAFGALIGVDGVCRLVATPLAGFAGESVGIVPVLVLAFQGICYCVAGCVMLVALRGEWASTDNGPHEAPLRLA